MVYTEEKWKLCNRCIKVWLIFYGVNASIIVVYVERLYKLIRNGIFQAMVSSQKKNYKPHPGNLIFEKIKLLKIEMTDVNLPKAI